MNKTKIQQEKVHFEKWNQQKQNIHFNDIYPFFREGEIRWVYFGKNIGTETFGKGQAFARPVLIFQKLYKHSCLAIPLTSKSKTGSYYFNFSDHKKKQFCAIFSQIRYLDGKRIHEKLSFVNSKVFAEIKEAFLCFIKKSPRS